MSCSGTGSAWVCSKYLFMVLAKVSNFPFESNEYSSKRNLLTASDLLSPRGSTLSFLGRGTANLLISSLVRVSSKCWTTISCSAERIGCCREGSSISQNLQSKSSALAVTRQQISNACCCSLRTVPLSTHPKDFWRFPFQEANQLLPVLQSQDLQAPFLIDASTS